MSYRLCSGKTGHNKETDHKKTFPMPLIRPALFFLCPALIIVSAFAPDAQARSLWEALFGASEPEQTQPAVTPEEMKNNPVMHMYGNSAGDGENTLKIDQPHRSPEEIADWGSGIVAQALSLTPDGMEGIRKKLSPDFSAYGMKEYETYLTDTQLLNTLTKNKLRIQTISDGGPQVLREGVVSGTYHWLVQVPVMASFYNRDLKSISRKNIAVGQNRKMIIQIQIGRTAKKDANPLGVEIERWIVVSGKK